MLLQLILNLFSRRKRFKREKYLQVVYPFRHRFFIRHLTTRQGSSVKNRQLTIFVDYLIMRKNNISYILAVFLTINSVEYLLVIWRRNRFQGTGSKVQEPVPKPGTRNRFLNIVSLTHCIIVYYTSLYSSIIKLMRLSFHFFIHSFIHSFIRCIYQQPNITIPAAGRLSSTIKIKKQQTN